jgi:hypothetical protein
MRGLALDSHSTLSLAESKQYSSTGIAERDSEYTQAQ